MAWAWIHAALAASPLLLAAAGRAAPRTLAAEAGSGCGLVAVALLALQFALTARFRWLEPPLGTDLLYAFHRHLTLVALAFALAHPVLSLGDVAAALAAADPRGAPPGLVAGTVALVALAALALTSYGRRRLRIPYDGWRRLHGALAVACVGGAAWHALALGSALAPDAARVPFVAACAAALGLLARVRLAKPWILSRRPWRVAEVRRERGDCVTLALEPVGHAGFRFRAGQFAWVTVGDSPFAAREHPFSISSGPDVLPRVEVTVKDAGDWTHRIQSLAPGGVAHVDGPFGTLAIDRYPRAAGFGLVAGGIGVAPLLSHLRTLAARGDRRPVLLVYGSGAWETTTFREELAALTARLPLRLVHVVARPAAGERWPSGETGILDRALLARHVRPELGWEWFVCGPPAMMDSVERSLVALGVPVSRVHSERFDLV